MEDIEGGGERKKRWNTFSQQFMYQSSNTFTSNAGGRGAELGTVLA